MCLRLGSGLESERELVAPLHLLVVAYSAEVSRLAGMAGISESPQPEQEGMGGEGKRRDDSDGGSGAEGADESVPDDVERGEAMLVTFLAGCGLRPHSPRELADLTTRQLGAYTPEDLYALDSGDFQRLGLKVHPK